LFLACALSSNAQLYLNTKTPYQPQQKNYTAPPQGYSPVFINYVGRHGARFQTSADKDTLEIAILEQGKNAHALTSDGLTLYKLMQLYANIEKDKYGDITMLGVQEQHGIAQRLQVENPTVFNNGKLLVEMTEKLRTQQSAHEFLSGLKGYDTAAFTSIIFPAKVDSTLRFYDLSKPYKSYVSSALIKKHIDSLTQDSRTTEVTENVCSKIFTKRFLNYFNSGNNLKANNEKRQINAVTFITSLYEIFASMYDAAIEFKSTYPEAIDLFNKIFSAKDLQWLDQLNSASDFYEKGPAEDINGIQVTIASPLLNNLIKTTDSAIAHKNYNAVLRFTHAEAISPLATLMEIPGASTSSNSVYHFYETWKASEIIPMSANIEWILYFNGNNYLIKVLLNEKEVALPLITKSYPYYNWTDVKSYYLNKLLLINKTK